jgi:inorganic pyrophosphatase
MSYKNIPIGKKSPKIINTIIEIPKMSQNKFEYDEDLDVLRLDRVLHSTIYYPYDYGFVPETLSEDGDHLDVMLIISTTTFPGCVISARPIGLIDMEDEAGQDWKIIAVAERDPRMKDVDSLSDLGPHFKKEVQYFFEQYKMLEDKKVKFKKWFGQKDAYKIIKKSQERFKNKKH